MSCWCGHGPWHHYGYAYPPPYPAAAYPPAAYPPGPYAPPPRQRRRGRARVEDLERHLAELEDELARVREDLARYRVVPPDVGATDTEPAG
jgi:hypothetical protein